MEVPLRLGPGQHVGQAVIGLRPEHHIDDRSAAGELGFAVYIGGGMGRTPMLGKKIRDFLPEADLLAYSEAILRVYNMYGRRDNKFKARIKILVHESGVDTITEEIEAEYEAIRHGVLALPEEEVQRIAAYFAPPAYENRPAASAVLERARLAEAARQASGTRTLRQRFSAMLVRTGSRPTNEVPKAA